MKTAISVEDALMEQADTAARSLGLSRSALVSEALRAFLRERRATELTEQFNLAYANEATVSERRLTRKLRTKLPITDKW